MNKFLLLILFSFSLTLSIITPGCKGKSTTWITLNDAENIMASSPDSAMTILRSIDIDRDGSEEEKARFALLMSMALDKSYIDTTSFDILQPAIDYYSRKGSPDDKLRTLYYQGRIYQNQGDDGAAMKCFVRATDLRDKINDSLTLAHNYVALGTLYINQYKVNEFIQCNLSAAELYRRIGKRRFEINSYCNALDGYTTLDNKNSADSMMAICIPLVQECADGEYRLFSSTISYTVNFGSPSDIIAFLNRYDGAELGASEAMNFVRGYFSAGENEKALDLLSNIRIDGQVFDSLKYTALKYQILEKEGEYKQALEQLTSYCVMSERYQKKLLSQDLLFIEDKHRIEMDNLIKIQNRDRIISYILLCLSLLLLLTGWLYFRYRFSLSKRLIAEKDADNLRLAQENLVLEKKRFEDERDNLRELLNEQTELSQPIQTAVKKRMDMLNSLLATEISNNDGYAKPYTQWIESIRKDKDEFMDSTRLAFSASHPNFIKYLENHGLSIDEINYLCLYAIGLRGKEVGEYIQLKRHYNISSEIRKKLGIDEHETNIGLYIRRKKDEL